MHTFSFPTTIHFGAGARHQLAAHLRSVKVRRPLVVTDRGIAGLPIVHELVAELRDGGLDARVYDGVQGDPLPVHVDGGVQHFQQHEADAVVGLGGGAALDVAKSVALMSKHPGGILDYAWDRRDRREVTAPLPHLVALPTTSGTGSEVGRSAIIADAERHVKRTIFSPALLARAVFADPELTLDLPPKITAATGIDALTHNVESYLSPVYHPFCDGIALEGVRIAARALPTAVHDGRDLTARSDMMMSSMMGAVAFQKELGAVHACAHALSAVLDLHHGLANGVMLDHVMRFNLPAAAEKMSELARVAGAGTDGAAFVHWLTELKQRIGLPARLREVGLTSEQVAAVAEIASQDACHQTNPRPVTRADLEQILRDAL